MATSPRCHLPTIRSRLRHGKLKLKKLASDAYIVHQGGNLVTGVLTLSQLEQWSWDQTMKSKFQRLKRATRAPHAEKLNRPATKLPKPKKDKHHAQTNDRRSDDFHFGPSADKG